MAAMLPKSITVASLLIICAATPPRPQYNSKQAVSSQSFVRHDVPLSYKYTAVHVYTTEKTEYQKDVPKIQYAPLYLPEELRMKNDLNTNVYHESDITHQNRDIRKDHLEPKELSVTPKTSHSSISYIPGHNIHLLQSVNRSPGLYTDYRGNPETTSELSTKSADKINYHRAFSVFKRPQNDGPSHRSLEIGISRLPPYDPSNQYNRIINPVNTVATFKANAYQIPQAANPALEKQLHRNQQRLQDIHELTKQIEAQKLSSHPKMNTLLLNLARVYNAHAPLNNHVNYLDNKQNKVPNAQSLVKGPAIKITSDHVSRLLPIRANSQISLHGQQ